jgi:hypothetical protein
MAIDSLTRDALGILERLVGATPDRKARRALEHLRHRLSDNERAESSHTASGLALRDADDGDDDSETDGDDFFDEDILQAAIQSGTAARLIACPPAVPLPAQTRIVEGAIAEARRGGLRLPPFALEWRDGRSEICAGAATWETASGRCAMFLSVNAWPDDLRLTALHELQHLADFGSGIHYSRVESERRAIAFTARCAGWR